MYLIIGRSAVGKSEIIKRVAERLGSKVLSSYTTRNMRIGEIEGIDHRFISKVEADKYRDQMIAHTELENDEGIYECFATKDQLLENDFYIIDPNGYYQLKDSDLDNVELVTIYIRVPYRVGIERALSRGDSKESYLARVNSEDKQFTEFEKSDDIDYCVLNDSTIKNTVAKVIRIIEKENRSGRN